MGGFGGYFEEFCFPSEKLPWEKGLRISAADTWLKKGKALFQKRLDPDRLPSTPLWTSQPLKGEVVTFLSLFMLSPGMTACLCVSLSHCPCSKCPHWHLPVTTGCNSLLPCPRSRLSLGLARGPLFPFKAGTSHPMLWLSCLRPPTLSSQFTHQVNVPPYRAESPARVGEGGASLLPNFRTPPWQ